MKIIRRLLVVTALMLGAVLAITTPAGANARAGQAKGEGPPPQLIESGTGHGQAVAGFLANADNPFNPVKDGYPPSNPVSGFTSFNVSFAGIIYGTPPGGGTTVSLYCFDLLTKTMIGVGYDLGTWNEANVPNVGYITQILHDYYPSTNEPTGLSDNAKAAAVQAAIWFFTDRYVLSTSDPLHDTAAAIVAAAVAAGPATEPPPSLSVTPAHAKGPAGSAVGPFIVTSSAPASVTATRAEMYSNAAATSPIANGTTIASGTRIWLKSPHSSSAVLDATARVAVPTGSVYLYDGNIPGLNEAQKLILAETATLEATASATAEFQAPGSIVVSKTISGSAAGHQGQVVIHVECQGTALEPDFVIVAGAPAGTRSHAYGNIPAGSVCTVTEPVNGSTSTTAVRVTGSGAKVTIPAGETAYATLTDAYTSSSSTKTSPVTPKAPIAPITKSTVPVTG